jgi:hypothetical protein
MAKTNFTSPPGERPEDRAALLREAAAESEDIDFEMRRERTHESSSQRFVQEARETGKSLLDNQKRAAADSLDGWVQALRKTAEQLQRDDSSVAVFAQRAADGLAEFSGSLRQRDVDSLIAQAQDFARRRPAIFLGGALVTGFVLARFLKSSGQRDFDERSSWEVQMGRNVTNSDSDAQFPESPDQTPASGGNL